MTNKPNWGGETKRTCTKCQEKKNISEFSPKRARGKWCEGCYLGYFLAYNRNRTDDRDGAERYQRDRRPHRLANKVALVRAHGGACSLCGYAKSAAALDFDHTTETGDPFPSRGMKNVNKAHTVSRLLASAAVESFEKAIEEAEKCVLVCSNCHRERTFPGLELREAPPETLQEAKERLRTRRGTIQERRTTSRDRRSASAKASTAIKALGERRSQPIERIDPKTGEVRWYPSSAAAIRDGFNAGCVSQAINGKLKHHKGFQWRRARSEVK